MKPVFEASNGLDAHLIANLLQQAGIEARIDGEFLQGGMGELPPMNLVRVVVAEEDHTEARSIIAEWEATQAEPIPEAPTRGGISGGLIGFLVGGAVGVGGMYLAYSTPVSTDGIDYNEDGVLDEVWTYRGGRISRTEIDRNLDGKVDFIFEYDHKGIVERSKSDDDFDGFFEASASYRHGNVRVSTSDLDRDGFAEYRAIYRYGVVEVVEISDAATRLVRKRQYFEAGKLSSAEFDLTGDGVLDTCYEYDVFEEIARTYACPAD